MNELHIGRFELNSQKQELLFHTSNGSVIKRKLSFRESSILQLLIEANGELVESHILLIEFWGSDTIYNMNSLYVFMSRMKRVLEADPTLSIINARVLDIDSYNSHESQVYCFQHSSLSLINLSLCPSI